MRFKETYERLAIFGGWDFKQLHATEVSIGQLNKLGSLIRTFNGLFQKFRTPALYIRMKDLIQINPVLWRTGKHRSFRAPIDSQYAHILVDYYIRVSKRIDQRFR